MEPIIAILTFALNVAGFLLFVRVVMSWLIQLQTVSAYNPTVSSLMAGLYALTEPMLRPIRRFVPNVGNFDISFFVAFGILYALHAFVGQTLPRWFGL